MDELERCKKQCQKLIEILDERMRRIQKAKETGLIDTETYGYLNIIRDTIPNRRADGWVSVEDRLPDNEEHYFVFTECDDEKFAHQAYFDKKLGWIPDIGYEAKVTHWMPLPQPPKEGE